MKLAIFSHKTCWKSAQSPTGYATDGGFPFQVRALSELFDETMLVVPVSPEARKSGEVPLTGHRITVRPLTMLGGSGTARKLRFPFWLLRNAPTLLSEALRADAIHAPVPGDVGSFGMVAGLALRKPLMVRYCGNWTAPRTAAERFWIRTMERAGGGRNVMFATGGGDKAPSVLNPAVEWIFSTSLAMNDFGCMPKSRNASDPVRLVIACRQQARKGTGDVIRTLPLLGPGYTLDVAGDGEALPSLRQLASDLHVSDRVKFHGKLGRQGVLDLLARSTLFCYPTRSSEGFPKVVLEALASGLPVVTTHVSVLPHLIGNECGELLNDTDPRSIAAAVNRCLEPERYGACSANAISTARNYSLERWRDAIGSRLTSAWGRLSEKTV